MKAITLTVLFLVAVLAAAGLTHAMRSRLAGPTDSIHVTKEDDSSMKTKDAPAKGPVLSKSGYDVTPLPQAKIDELAKKLTPEEAKVILRKGTEPAFCGTFTDNHKDGTYICRLCGLPLFKSDAKFDSGTGWPSFFQPFDKAHIKYIEDNTLGMRRIETECARCGSHLGHVFEDGPRPTGLRYCMNSVSLDFVEQGTPLPEASQPIKTAVAYFAGGCFWGTEDLFQQVPGVINVISGYQGGTTKNPTYKEVCTDKTGHAETVRVEYDPARVGYDALLKQFFRFHDPTQLNMQGPDHGTQYRSAIFTETDEQYDAAKKFIAEQQGKKRFSGKKIVTEVRKVSEAGPFYPAEEYHQDYHEKHGGHCTIPIDDDE
jgi:peptide methionine sulfoxide reductase msrA/msrB